MVAVESLLSCKHVAFDGFSLGRISHGIIPSHSPYQCSSYLFSVTSLVTVLTCFRQFLFSRLRIVLKRPDMVSNSISTLMDVFPGHSKLKFEILCSFCILMGLLASLFLKKEVILRKNAAILNPWKFESY
jgi:hypothetical protein